MAEKYFNSLKDSEFVVNLEGETPRSRILSILKNIPGTLKLSKEATKYYQPIKKSIYLERKQKNPSEDDIYICDCIKSTDATKEQLANSELSFDCKEKCINRFICTECELKSCPCAELCNNRQFQLHQDRAVYPFKAGGKGWGLRAGELIPRGSFILQYVGEIFSIYNSIGQERMLKYAKSTCTYLMRLSPKEVIDPTDKGNIARFMNHSCEPNCITQKWNVLGEIGVGIFALKDIEKGQELTFDYKFDVYKTPLSRCLCGTKSCKGYLGLMPTEYSYEEWEHKIDNLPCEICKGNYENDDFTLILCDSCNNGFHMDCLTPKLNEVPVGAWYCPDCKLKENIEEKIENENKEIKYDTNLTRTLNIRNRKKIQFNQIKDSILKDFENYFKQTELFQKFKTEEFIKEVNSSEESPESHKFILSPIELAVFKEKGYKFVSSVTKLSIFWNNSYTSYRNFFNKRIELTVIGTKPQINFVKQIINSIEKINKNFKENSGNIQKIFKIPAIFLKRVLGEYYCNLKEVEKLYSVKIHFNRAHITDDCYPIHFMTSVILQGRNQNIIQAHDHIKKSLECLVARRKYMTRNDIRIIISKLVYIKKQINPTEIRCCRDNALRDINHPFYTIYYKNKEVAFIGDLKEVKRAEKIVARVINENRRYLDNSFSLNYLIPVCEKGLLLNIKSRVERVFPGNKMIVYDPLHPRKNVSITLSSTYEQFDEFFEYVRKELDRASLFTGMFETYQTQMLYQMSKYFFKYLQNYIQTKSMVFMKSWDSITAEYDEKSVGYKSALNILFNEVSKDNEFRFYILRVNSLYKNRKMSNLGIRKEDFLHIIKSTLKRKNDCFISMKYSVFRDPLSDKLPDDYEAFSEKTFFKDNHYNHNHHNNYNPHHNQNRRYFNRNTNYIQKQNYYPRYKRNFNNRNYYNPHHNNTSNFNHNNQYVPPYTQNHNKPYYHNRAPNINNERKSRSSYSSSSLSSSSSSSKVKKNKKFKKRGYKKREESLNSNSPERKKTQKYRPERYRKTSIDSNNKNGYNNKKKSKSYYNNKKPNHSFNSYNNDYNEKRYFERKKKDFLYDKPKRFSYNYNTKYILEPVDERFDERFEERTSPKNNKYSRYYYNTQSNTDLQREKRKYWEH